MLDFKLKTERSLKKKFEFLCREVLSILFTIKKTNLFLCNFCPFKRNYMSQEKKQAWKHKHIFQIQRI